MKEHLVFTPRFKFAAPLALSLLVGACGGGGSSSSTGGGGDSSSTENSGTGTSAPAQTGSIPLSWVAPSSRADGSALALSEIVGYTVYYGETPGDYPYTVEINDVSVTSVTTDDLPLGTTYYFVMTTRDFLGQESEPSEILEKQAS